MTPLPVLIVLHEPQVGGATTAVLRALPSLAERGWEFSFWAPCPSPVASLLSERGWPVTGEERPLRYSRSALREPPGPARRLARTPGYLRRLRSHIRAQRPALVHVNTLVCLPEVVVARSAATPTLLHVHELLPGGPRGAISSQLAKVADHTATVSLACARPLRERGLSPSLITAGLALPPPRRTRIAGRPLVVGTLATVSHRKGSDLFVAAATHLARDRPEVEFRMIGPLAPGCERAWAQALRHRAETSGIHCGETAQPLDEIADWDVFVLPTRADPFPLVVLEAMATGLPVVASDVDGVPEQLDRESGVLVRPEDPIALALAVAALLDDEQRRQSLGAAARERVRTKFSPERHARELERAYRIALTASEARATRRRNRR